jgi:hypothetical protein
MTYKRYKATVCDRRGVCSEIEIVFGKFKSGRAFINDDGLWEIILSCGTGKKGSEG